MITTKFTELLGCSVPIQQAAIGDLATPGLAAAVAEAGGLGMVCMYDLSPAEIEKVLGNLRRQTSGRSMQLSRSQVYELWKIGN